MQAIHRRTLLMAGLGLASSWNARTAAAAPRRAGLVLITGNSHSIGWIAALPSDRFSDKVLEFTQEGHLAPVAGTILDAGDANPAFGAASLGPSLTFLNALAAERGDLDHIVAVAVARGSTGFIDGTWSTRLPRHSNNLLARTVQQWKEARQALIQQGYEVVPICALHLTARPDVHITSPALVTENAGTYATEVDAYVDFLRRSLDGVDATFPIIYSCAITLKQMKILGGDLVCFASAGNGLAWRRPATWFVDPVNDWGDGERSHLPIVPFDDAHANRDGALAEGRLAHAALARAIANRRPHAPFSELDCYGSLESLYDFRSGTALDMTGAAHLQQVAGAPGVIRYSTLFGTFAFAGLGIGDRSFRRSLPIAPRYTIALRLALATSVTSQYVLAGLNADPKERFSLFIDERSRVVVVWGNASIVSPPLQFPGNRIVSLAVVYDGKDLRMFQDGREVGSAPIGLENRIEGLFIGGHLPDRVGRFDGEMQYCAIFPAALGQAQLTALAEASFSRP